MGRGKAKSFAAKAKKPKTAIQLKREERKAKRLLPRPPPIPVVKKPAEPKENKAPPKPKPKPQNPGFQKWAALFKRELVIFETFIKNTERFRQHWRAEIDKMDEEERRKWESGEVGNWVRLLKSQERGRELLAMAREQNAWIVPPKKLGLKKTGLGMEGFVLGASTTDKAVKAKGTIEKADTSSDNETKSMDTDDEEVAGDSGGSVPTELIPLNVHKKAPQVLKDDTVDISREAAAEGVVESNPYFVVDTNPTPVHLNGALKKGKKRPKEDDGEVIQQVKKSKKEKTVDVVPESETGPELARKPKSEPSNVDFSAIEAQLQAELEAGTKAKEEREKANVDARPTKEKKRKRFSEGDGNTEKDVKKAKKEEKKKEKKDKKRERSNNDVQPDEGSKKKHKVTA